ncbi:hypothetical protein LJR231_003455 [Phyllobacterium sp. LjRoot231]|uniref:hypothetical protein n=1 Tax=Phyllobacterium sp. LjRoot231 TaxID=3342289 RepID=UPI003ECD3AD8
MTKANVHAPRLHITWSRAEACYSCAFALADNLLKNGQVLRVGPIKTATIFGEEHITRISMVMTVRTNAIWPFGLLTARKHLHRDAKLREELAKRVQKLGAERLVPRCSLIGVLEPVRRCHGLPLYISVVNCYIARMEKRGVDIYDVIGAAIVLGVMLYVKIYYFEQIKALLFG